MKVLGRLFISLILASIYLTAGYYGMKLIDKLTCPIQNYLASLPELLMVFLGILCVLVVVSVGATFIGIGLFGVAVFPSFIFSDED